MKNAESIRLEKEAYTTVRAWNYEEPRPYAVLLLAGTVFSASANMTIPEMEQLAAQLLDCVKECRENMPKADPEGDFVRGELRAGFQKL